MDLLNSDPTGTVGTPEPPREEALDAVLEAQFIIAWAGETGEGENRRLGWWRTQLGDEYAGVDLLRRLLPSTWRWAVLEAAREAARREEGRRSEQGHDPDGVISLFGFGFQVDERLEERLDDLKRSSPDPETIFPHLRMLRQEGYRPDALKAWLEKRPTVEAVATPSGRRIRGDAPEGLVELVDGLLAALLPLVDEYPAPHYRRSR